MRSTKTPRRRAAVLAVALLVAAFGSAPALAKSKKGKPDPALVCASAKQHEAGQYCAAVLRAWARAEKSGDAGKRDDAITRASSVLADAWSRIEQKASGAGTECGGAFLASSTAGAFVATAASDLAGDVNAGLDLGVRDQARCGARLLGAAAAKCQALLQAESLRLRLRGKATAEDKYAKAVAAAEARFSKAFAKAAGGACPTTATASGLEAGVDAIAARITRDILASPEAGDGTFRDFAAGPTTYQGIALNPTCLNGTPYRFWARRGTVNKLVVYYQGGGACWEQITCSLPACDTSVADDDNPGLDHAGFADVANPANPFRDWNFVFVSYCSCDIHFGDAAQDYANFDPAHPKHAEHRGYHNARAVEKWAREHFLAPERVFVAGSSAGAYGAQFHAPLLHQVWPSARFSVLADAGNGVVTQSFLDNYFPNWNFEKNLPPDIPELKTTLHDGSGIPGYIKIITGRFPNTTWAHYATAFDGSSGGQTGFYNIMLNNNDVLHALTWWEGSCAFNAKMRMQAIDTAAAVDATSGNYRYFIGSGTRHTVWGSNKVYDDTTGGIPPLVDWVNAMLASTGTDPDPGWVNVEANPENVLLPGDPRPSPLAAPFEMSGADVVVNCPAP